MIISCTFTYGVPFFFFLVNRTARRSGSQDSSLLLLALPLLAALQHASNHMSSFCPIFSPITIYEQEHLHSTLCVFCIKVQIVSLSSVWTVYDVQGMTSIFWLFWRAQASRRCLLSSVLNRHSCGLSEIAMISISGSEILDVSCQAPALQNRNHGMCHAEELHPLRNQHSTTFPATLQTKRVGTNLSAFVF